MPIRRYHSADVNLEQRGDEPIICKVCLFVYNDGHRVPLILNCHHTYCAACIADSLTTPQDRSRVFCPLCKSKTTLGKQGIAGLQINVESLKLVQSLEIRKQMEQMQMERMIGEIPDWGRSPYDNVSAQSDYPLGEKKNEPGKPKGILKVNNKPRRVEIAEFPMGAASPGNKNAHGRVCTECAAKVSPGNKTQTSVSQQHTVIVKSANRLHPPPSSSDVDAKVQQFLEAGKTDQEHSVDEGDDLENDEVGIGKGTSKFDCFRKNEVHEFLKPPFKCHDPSFITTETASNPFIRTSDETTVGDPSQPSGRIYPVNALLYMASTEGVPLRIGSSGVEEVDSNVALPQTALNDSQRSLPSGAKYVGRFGKYNDKRQPGSFNNPQRIACTQDGTRLAVTDPASLVVHVFTSKGEFTCCFSAFGVTGAVCFLNDGNLALATDKGIQVYTINGTLQKTIPLGEILAVASFKQGFVAATKNRISVCKSVVGSVIHSINGKRDSALMQKQIPFEEVVDIAVGPKDELCILETKILLVTNEEGVILSSVQPDQQSLCGPIGRAVALTICSEDRSVAVADAGNRRVLQFGLDGQFIRCLLNLEDVANGVAAECNVCSIAVNRSRKMYIVAKGKQMAEVRVFAI